MAQDILIIGSTGYLGQRVAQWLGKRAKTTYRTAPKFPNSLPYDFYAHQPLPIDVATRVVIFTAAVEVNSPTNQLEVAMRRLLDQLSNHRFVYVSSDAVFSGEEGNYTEDDPPTPVNAYGKNLALCEKLVQEMVVDSCIVRPSYIYGFLNGRLDQRLSRVHETLLRGETYTAYNDYYKSPLSVNEVAEAVVAFANLTYRGPIHVAGSRMSAHQFYQRAMATLRVDTAGLRPEPMPVIPGFMRDTSLNSSRWWTMRGGQPMTVEQALI